MFSETLVGFAVIRNSAKDHLYNRRGQNDFKNSYRDSQKPAQLAGIMRDVLTFQDFFDYLRKI